MDAVVTCGKAQTKMVMILAIEKNQRLFVESFVVFKLNRVNTSSQSGKLYNNVVILQGYKLFGTNVSCAKRHFQKRRVDFCRLSLCCIARFRSSNGSRSSRLGQQTAFYRIG